MNVKAKAIKTLYKAGRISIDGVKKAVEDGIITKEQYLEITGKQYPEVIIDDIIEEKV